MEFPAELPEGAVVTEVRGHVLLIGLNRPSKRNCVTPVWRNCSSMLFRQRTNSTAPMRTSGSPPVTRTLRIPSFAICAAARRISS